MKKLTAENIPEVLGKTVEIFTGPEAKSRGVRLVRKTAFGVGAESLDGHDMIDLSLADNPHYEERLEITILS